MRPRALRPWLFAWLVLALWAVAIPAMAAPAPYCDDLGASALAPPPTFEPTDDAIRAALADGPCPFNDDHLGPAVAPGHPQEVPSSSAQDPAVASGPLILLPPRGCEDIPPVEHARMGSAGVRWRVERPPRTSSARAAKP